MLQAPAAQLATRNSLAETTAMILAGGLGTRLRTVVSDRSKVIAPVFGRPFISYLLDQLEWAGVERAVLCTGHGAEGVEDAFGRRHGALRLSYSREPEPLGTAGALRLALPQCESSSVLVLNGDSYVDADLPAFHNCYRISDCAGAMLLTPVDDVARYGRVQADAASRVSEFEEKGRHSGPGWINSGVYLFERDLLAMIPPARSVSLEREMLPSWILFGLHAVHTRGRFLDIGTPDSYAQAEAFFSVEWQS